MTLKTRVDLGNWCNKQESAQEYIPSTLAAYTLVFQSLLPVNLYLNSSLSFEKDFVIMKAMSETVLATIGVAAGIINLTASIPYFIDIFRGNTKPERATWWIWFALGSVGLFGQIAGGARWSLVLATTSVLVAGATAVLSVKYGYGKFHTRDGVALLITAVGIVLSFIYHNPLIVISAIFIIDSIAGCSMKASSSR